MAERKKDETIDDMNAYTRYVFECVRVWVLDFVDMKLKLYIVSWKAHVVLPTRSNSIAHSFCGCNIFSFQECSIFIFEKRCAEKLHKPKRKETVTEILRNSVKQLERFRHPKVCTHLDWEWDRDTHIWLFALADDLLWYLSHPHLRWYSLILISAFCPHSSRKGERERELPRLLLYFVLMIFGF